MRRVGWSRCLIPNAGGLTSVACSSPFQCVAVNTVGIVTSDVNTGIGGKRLLGRASRATLTRKIAFTPSHHATVRITKTLVVER
jgi:hypothetical protein